MKNPLKIPGVGGPDNFLIRRVGIFAILVWGGIVGTLAPSFLWGGPTLLNPTFIGDLPIFMSKLIIGWQKRASTG